MPEDEEEISIEINAPPKSIEIESPSVTNQPVILAGGVDQTPQASILSLPPQNVTFVMGPGGQLVAIEKPPFVWKHFWIGGGIPFALYFIPLLIIMLGSGLGFDSDHYYEQIEITKEENSTLYKGEFTIDSKNRQYLEWCGFRTPDRQEVNLYCENYNDHARILSPNWDGEVVGNWTNENGTVYFDSGIDYGDELQMEIEYTTDAGQFFSIFEDLAGLTCCLGFILSLVMLIVGFSQGKPGMGWGGVSALALLPVNGIFLAFVLW
jgi:hypothetical protein